MRTSDINLLLDEQGGVYVADTSLHAGPYQAVIALTATVIASMTCAKLTGTLTSITVPAGTTLVFPGSATALTLTSGTCILVNQ